MKFDDFCSLVQSLQRQTQRAIDEGEVVGGGGGPRDAQRGTPPPPSLVYDVSGEFDASAVVWSPPGVIPDVPSHSMVTAAVRAAADEVRAGERVEVTPPTNRGVKFTIHGATITVFAPIDEVADLVASEYFQDFCVLTDRGLERFEEAGRVRFYEAFYRGPNGMSLKTGFAHGPNHVSVDLKGEVFEVHGVAPFARLLANLQERGFRWHLTRIDTAWDHHNISPGVLKAAHAAGNLRSLTERRNWDWNENDDGQTFYFGKRGSSGFLRCYNMRGYNRLEVENREKRSKWLGLQLVNAPLEKWSEISMGNLRDFVDLVDASSDKCVSRRKLLPVWAEFIGACERVKVRLSDSFHTLSECAVAVVERLKQQHRRIGRAVAVVRSLLGAEGFKKWVDEAERDFEGRHRVRLAELTTVVGSYAEMMGEKIEDLLFDRHRSLAL